MQPWESRRANAYATSFAEDLVRIGVDTRAFDVISPNIDAVLCGVTRQDLDAVYPARSNDRRIILTDASLGVPALRISFCIDGSDGDRVVFEHADRREQVDS